MEPSRFDSFGNLLRATAEMQTQGRLEITEIVFRMWVKGLQNWSYSEVETAFSRFLLTDSRMPTLNDIAGILRGSDEDLALGALIKIERAIGQHGSYATVVFDDPVIHIVISDLGGWIRTCRQTEYEFTWWKKEFRERYLHQLRSKDAFDIPTKLFGIFDQTNLPLGCNPQKPTIIGNYEKAIAWVSKLSNSDSISLKGVMGPPSQFSLPKSTAKQ